MADPDVPRGALGGHVGALPCPCGSGTAYDACCGPLHRGETVAATAELLMRSRYAGYALGQEDYLLATWHPSTRPASLSLDRTVRWEGLEIIESLGGGPEDSEGEVEFVARYREHGRAARLHERSRFRRRGGRWVYLDG